MDGKITANEFAKDFCDKVKEYKSSYHNNTQWTKIVLGKGGIVNQIFQKHELEFSKEYYRIDAIGWKKDDDKEDYKIFKAECEQVKLKAVMWSLEVAVEHENSDTNWLEEICKLAYINCPLRVVIGYSMNKNNNDERAETVKKKLQNKHAINAGQEYLLMLGTAGKNSEPEYKSYLFKLNENNEVYIDEEFLTNT